MDDLEHALTRLRDLQRELGASGWEMSLSRRLGYVEQLDVVLEALRPMMVETRCCKGLRMPCEVCKIYPPQACPDGEELDV